MPFLDIATNMCIQVYLERQDNVTKGTGPAKKASCTNVQYYRDISIKKETWNELYDAGAYELACLELLPYFWTRMKADQRGTYVYIFKCDLHL